jgi:hypothetical protein
MENPAWHRSAASLLATVALLALLSGCSALATGGVAAFDREQAETDRLPDGVGEGLTEDSSRLLFTKGEVQYFVSESTVDDEVCLIVYVSTEAWSSSCSGGLPITSFVEGGDEAQLNGMAVGASSDTWNQVADNLALKK